MPATQTAEQPVSSEGFEAFLTEVEAGVSDAAHVQLFHGARLRLEITLLKHERNPRVIWGLKGHEDWAFKATLLRFARGAEPTHLVLAAEQNGSAKVRGWEVSRTMDAFRSKALPESQLAQLGCPVGETVRSH
ncbi:hypothetical protein [Geothrix sp. PMB-07]|uniref:hypothetical protein n=1 Tax=Geothrix sp. PMB-07 TaxID=3068640 RepID=UPI00274054D6|nr:hypothetical protein [Geothrix sp. PMB-07]WLT31894.1 hypothetical protein Q9293_00915 [Geothrix sp. PMB-07]